MSSDHCVITEDVQSQTWIKQTDTYSHHMRHGRMSQIKIDHSRGFLYKKKIKISSKSAIQLIEIKKNTSPSPGEVVFYKN